MMYGTKPGDHIGDFPKPEVKGDDFATKKILTEEQESVIKHIKDMKEIQNTYGNDCPISFVIMLLRRKYNV